MKKWTEKEICIAEIDTLLQNGYEVEVDSPDGFVPVSAFVNKGFWQKYTLTLEDGREVDVNENHLFETDRGWKFAKDITHEQQVVGHKPLQYLCDNGWQLGTVRKSNYQIPIVDIQVEHENHRYYTNGISSHNTGVGKSMFMCHMAASCLSQGHNVLYITLEMAEERIAERIDANLLNVSMGDLHRMTKGEYDRKFEALKVKTHGKLIIKEYPTASANSLHFRALLNELHLKKNFQPQIIFIDYLNICSSARLKPGANVNSYSYIKAIAEELRGLAVEFNLPIVSATQTTRAGYCLDLSTKVITKDGEKFITNINIGDKIQSINGWNTVTNIWPTQIRERYLIKTESGKSIICSGEHKFPIDESYREKTINDGLSVGDVLIIK